MATTLTAEQRAWRWRILISTYVGYTGYYLTRKTFTLCKTTLADEWGVQVGQTAHIWFAFLAAYMVGQFVCSYVGRKWGPRVLLLAGLGISILVNALFGFSNSFYTFLALMIVNGLAQASGWPGVVGAVALWLRPHERGKIMGFWATNYAMGNIVVKTLAPVLLGHWGWRWAFWGCTVVSLAIWFLLLVWQRDRPEDAGLDPIVDEGESRQRQGRAVESSQARHIAFSDYARLALNPVVVAMGSSYFCVKFLRYALDSWLPAFLNIQGMDVTRAGLYSEIFDWAGLAGAIAAGWLLDRVFRGNWAVLCFLMSLGMVAGYLAVIYLGSSPVIIALCFGLVGFMLYGPDTVMSATACVEVAGEANGVALAGIVNGIGSIGPLVQEQVIGWLMRGEDEMIGIRNTNRLALGMSIAFTCLMLGLILRLRALHKAQPKEVRVP
ncbi:MAG TPA: MFS transporter [Candidatus Hydrogenedentes bacterium]|nr:MFS transporter [Candidatus Hydrogenedentota bacterium]HPG69742.1 MFS transporter [Candidatus Hydrogenedentota bacterium]